MTERERMRRLQLFMASVRKTGYCWFWSGAVNKAGYGTCGIGGKSKLAHRSGWALMRGPIPAGMLLLHECDNPRCVNPNHLRVGTVLDNVRDAWDRNRYPSRKGTANGRAKLTLRQVVEIRADTTSTNVELSRKYGVTDVAIGYARSGKTWAIPEFEELTA